MQVDTESQISVEEISNALVVTPRFRRLDATVAPAFRDYLAPRLRDRRLVVFALGNIRFMDSSGLGSLVSALKLLPAGGVVRLAEVTAPVEKLLAQTRLDHVLPAFPTVALAVHGVVEAPGREREEPRRPRTATGQ